MTGTWYPNRRAGMVPTGPNQLRVAGITYVRLERTFVFLAVVIDVFSRKVIGYAIGPTLDAALESRQPPPGCVHHSDRGSQGEFNRSSQHLPLLEVRDGTNGCPEVESQYAPTAALTWAAAGRTA